jgi:hypothetical protein
MIGASYNWLRIFLYVKPNAARSDWFRVERSFPRAANADSAKKQIARSDIEGDHLVHGRCDEHNSVVHQRGGFMRSRLGRGENPNWFHFARRFSGVICASGL